MFESYIALTETNSNIYNKNIEKTNERFTQQKKCYYITKRLGAEKLWLQKI